MTKTTLEAVLMGFAYSLEYIFKSVAQAADHMSMSAGTGMIEHPTMTGAAFAGGGLGLALVIYLMARSLRRIMYGLAGLAMGFVLLGGSFSILLIAHAPPTTPIIHNMTNFTNFTNATIGT